jgi:hypothetical protein
MLLPKHPYSSDLYQAVSVVAPMYPHITVVMGSAYDFRDMCAQYVVRSYPQLLFFKKGLLLSRYEGEHTPEALAQQFAQWTQSLPQALPKPKKDVILVRKNDALGTNKAISRFAPDKVVYHQELFGKNITVTVPYSSEPIMGSIEALVPYDSIILILSGVYTAVRLGYYLYSQFRPSVPH